MPVVRDNVDGSAILEGDAGGGGVEGSASTRAASATEVVRRSLSHIVDGPVPEGRVTVTSPRALCFNPSCEHRRSNRYNRKEGRHFARSGDDQAKGDSSSAGARVVADPILNRQYAYVR